MASRPVTATLVPPGPFWSFNREEGNAVGILVGLLAQPGNLTAFTRLLEWRPADIDDAEVCVEWTYLRDLWNWHSTKVSPEQLRAAVLDCLEPRNRSDLEGLSVLEFNSYFGAVPRPSTSFIQSPSNWSVLRFAANITDPAEFRRTCRFKWAFNVKPDLVVQTPSGAVLCVEAKWSSGEGRYPSSEAEKAVFREREVAYLTQTEVQRYLVEDVLGFDGTFAYLARRQATTEAGRTITWRQILHTLDRSGAPAFVQRWCELAIAGVAVPDEA
jgi:hypothetical protein